MPRIAICAPSTPITPEVAERVTALAEEQVGTIELDFHPQCFAVEGHFAGSDTVRLAALVECANSRYHDGVWFARGGYGAVRIAEAAIARFEEPAGWKFYVGYSDAGTLLGGLYARGIGQLCHGPMPNDIRRPEGEAAVLRSLEWMDGLEVQWTAMRDAHPTVAFNLTTLAMLCGTSLMPDLTGHVVMLEEVSEHLYAIDRLFFHLVPHLRGAAGIRLGRIGAVPENDRPFGASAEEIARYWCERHGIPFLGDADIGHDSDNQIVQFGLRLEHERA